MYGVIPMQFLLSFLLYCSALGSTIEKLFFMVLSLTDLLCVCGATQHVETLNGHCVDR